MFGKILRSSRLTNHNNGRIHLLFFQKNPSIAESSGEHPFFDIDLTRLFFLQSAKRIAVVTTKESSVQALEKLFLKYLNYVVLLSKLPLLRDIADERLASKKQLLKCI